MLSISTTPSTSMATTRPSKMLLIWLSILSILKVLFCSFRIGHLREIFVQPCPELERLDYPQVLHYPQVQTQSEIIKSTQKPTQKGQQGKRREKRREERREGQEEGRSKGREEGQLQKGKKRGKEGR